MKIKYLPIYCFIMVLLASCSSAYRIGQTPDDVYYSPAPPQPVAYVTPVNQQEKDGYGYNNSSNNQPTQEAGVYNANYDPYYGSGGLSLGIGSGYYPSNNYGSSFYNPYSFYSPLNSWAGISPYYNYSNSFYSPYYNNYNAGYYGSFYTPNYYYTPIYVTGKSTNTGIYSGPRQYNLAVYNNSRRSANTNNFTSVPVRSFVSQQQQTPATSNPETGRGSFIRRIFSPSNNSVNRSNNNINRSNNNDNYQQPVRDMSSSPSRSNSNNNSSSSPASGNSGGGGGSAPVRSFRR